MPLLSQNDKIIVGGTFDAVGGTAAPSIARLTSTGARDATFNGPSQSSTAEYYSISVQPGGKLLVGGDIRLGTSSSYFGRLNVDGALDTTFAAYVNDIVYVSQTLTDGRVMIGGLFNRIGANLTTRNRIARLMSDGTPDLGFRSITELSSFFRVHDFGIQGDGKIVFGGNFIYPNGTSGAIARVEEDGTFDTTYDPQITGGAYGYAVAMQANGKAVVGGYFTNARGQSRKSLLDTPQVCARLRVFESIRKLRERIVPAFAVALAQGGLELVGFLTE